MKESAEPQRLARLEIEWRNHSAQDFMLGERLVSMRRLKARVLAIKAAESYAQTWLSLVLGEHERHAHNEEYVARLLVLLDERPVPINPLQRSLGLQLGHLFRTLGERAGVDFRAHTSTMRARIREDYYPWPAQVFVDAENHRLLFGDRCIPIPEYLDVFKKTAENLISCRERRQHVRPRMAIRARASHLEAQRAGWSVGCSESEPRWWPADCSASSRTSGGAVGPEQLWTEPTSQ